MRYIITVTLLTFACNILVAQNSQLEIFEKDSLIVIEKKPSKNFFNNYILFIPKGTKRNSKTFLLVEPNNTGKPSDSIEVHKKHAIDLAAVSSVGNNISTQLRIPFLVPIFPRPASKPLTYTHALDRDVMVEKSNELKRLDLQLLEMIRDAKNILKALTIEVEDKIFMSGFSASATFTNRFSFLHPDKIQALAIGGFNGELMFPQNEINSLKINYPIGINYFEKLFNQKFNFETYKSIPQLIYMGQLDENDAVQYDDAYNKKERKIINDNIGATVQKRYLECQKVYLKANINATFKTYENVGHWTTSNMNLEVIKFFLAQMKQSKK
ncbi:conserved exported hypothetical protein [Flavobacterium sp. 9R]|uniref:hypothetical protein n=1 Tax=Flavobacterium sp. 9R TaxID=2653143 RepID=UPI0012F2CF8F|nr:hypothetical protein [Flavobacterium sp. 9R]VXB81981.1 conserved exported hypothetical protein [Flavobacterium sp. 9R]